MFILSITWINIVRCIMFKLLFAPKCNITVFRKSKFMLVGYTTCSLVTVSNGLCGWNMSPLFVISFISLLSRIQMVCLAPLFGTEKEYESNIRYRSNSNCI